MRRFALRFAMWLPLLFLGWYWLMPLGDAAVGRVAGALIGAFTHGEVTSASGAAGTTFRIWTFGDDTVVTAITEARLYTWGLPLAASVCLACSARRAWRMAAVFAAAIVTAAWGMGFDVLAQLLRDAPEALRPLSSAKANGVALGYQFGSLMFPGLVPCLVAVVLYRGELAALASHGLRAVSAGPASPEHEQPQH